MDLTHCNQIFSKKTSDLQDAKMLSKCVDRFLDFRYNVLL
jgi:hypothetical protein